MYPAYNPYTRGRLADPHYGYGRSHGQDDEQDVLARIAQAIYERQRERATAPPPPTVDNQSLWPMYLHGAPRPEGLSPLGRFTDMAWRQRADAANAAAEAQAMAKEKEQLRKIMEDIRRPTVGPVQAGQPVATFPSGAQEISTDTGAAIDSPYGTGSVTFQPRTQEATFGGMPASEFFQRAANAGAQTSFAQPEPGYAGRPFSPAGSPNYTAWERATQKFRKPRAA